MSKIFQNVNTYGSLPNFVYLYSMVYFKNGNMIELLLSDEQSFSAEDTNLSAFLKHPVRVNGGAVFFCTAGHAVVSIDLQEHVIGRDMEVLLLTDTVFMLVEASADFRVIFFASSLQMFDGAMQRLNTECFHYLENHPAIRHYGATVDTVKKLYAVILAAGGETENIYRSQIMYLLIRHILLNLCDKVRRNYIRSQEEGGRRKRELYDRFVKLIAAHFTERRDVAFYAQELCISMSYLASVTRTVMGETPKETIDKWIVQEIKLMLVFSDLSLQQISDRMSFPDQSYLSRYFKHHTGSSPIAYRNAK